MRVFEIGNKTWKSALFTIRMKDLASDQNYVEIMNLQIELQIYFQNDGLVATHKTQISQEGLNFIDDGEHTHEVLNEVEMPTTTTYATEAFMFKIYGMQNLATKDKIMILYDDESGDSLWPTMELLKSKLMTKDNFVVSSIKLIKVQIEKPLL